MEAKHPRMPERHYENPEEEITATIRQAEAVDARAILGLLRHVGRETPYLTFGPQGSRLNVAQEVQLIEHYAASQTSLLLVVEVDDQIIGLANLSTRDKDKQSHVAELGICIIKDYWGYGIGQMVIEELLTFAKKVGLRVITLEVVVENKRAVSLYQKFGFEIKGELTDRLHVGLKYLNAYIMEKVL